MQTISQSVTPPRLRGARLAVTRSLLSDYVSLMKPKIIVLLLISTVCPMVLASRGDLTFAQIFWALLGGSLVSGSASAMNCIWDCDIDQQMQRTKDRPLPAGRLSIDEAFFFSIGIGLLGVFFLSYFLNPIAGIVSIFGHVFYVLIYTMWLKRSTPQNIVIGGAAGAVPPVVGWVAMTGSVDLTAILLFLIVFLWTPPHFWALALNKNEDYKRANVPMLPVIAGEQATYTQMYWYALSLIPTSLLLVLSDKALGWFSATVLTGLGAYFFYTVVRLKNTPGPEIELKEKRAWSVFGFSLVYLALFFVCLVVDALFV